MNPRTSVPNFTSMHPLDLKIFNYKNSSVNLLEVLEKSDQESSSGDHEYLYNILWQLIGRTNRATPPSLEPLV